MSSFYKLHIKEVKHETPNAISVAFTIPAELKSVYTFIAGQYVNLKLTLDGQEIRRAYSICSSPNSGELRIAIVFQKTIQTDEMERAHKEFIKKDNPEREAYQSVIRKLVEMGIPGKDVEPSIAIIENEPVALLSPSTTR
jgi:hypothetical protein